MKIRLPNGTYDRVFPLRYFHVNGYKLGIHKMRNTNGHKMPDAPLTASLVPYGVRIPLSESRNIDSCERAARKVIKRMGEDAWKQATEYAKKVWREAGGPW